MKKLKHDYIHFPYIRIPETKRDDYRRIDVERLKEKVNEIINWINENENK